MIGRIVIAAALAVTAGCQRKSKNDESHSPAHERKALELAAELAKIDFAIDTGRLRFEIRSPAEGLEDMDRQQDMFFPPSYFEGLRLLRHIWFLPAPDSAKAFRTLSVAGVLDTVQAYYQPDRDALVFVDNALDKLVDLDLLVAHELVHAYQDQHLAGGLEAWMEPARHSLDASSASQCLLEGMAEAVASAAMLARKGRTLATVDVDDFDTGLDRLFSGEAGLPYTIGRTFMIRRFQQGGWPAVEAAMGSRPSTEQLIHPQKLSVDEPVEVVPPPLPASLAGAELVHRDTIGEMMIYTLLIEYGVDDAAAWLSAAGWDGDGFGVYREQNGRMFALWRIVFDREIDAIQFADSVRRAGAMRPRRVGRVLDLFYAESADTGIALQELYRDDVPPSYPRGERDAATTEAMERDYVATRDADATVVGARWIHRRHGVAVPIPPGWQLDEILGMKVIAGPVIGGFRDNITVVAQPNLQGWDLDGLAQNHLDTLGKLDTMTLAVTEVRKLQGRDVLFLEYYGKMPDSDTDLHFLSVVFLHKDRYVAVTVTIVQEHWRDVEALANAVLGGLEFLD